MNSKARSFLFDLLSTPSPTGFETPGQRKWADYVGRFADSTNNDAYGTAWASLVGQGKGKGKAPKKVMFEAHPHEIGYIVKHITSDGFLRLDRIGGSDAATARGRKLLILGDKKKPVTGIIGNTAIHIRENIANEKSPKIHELYVDVGASTRKEVARMGIRVGHPAVYADCAEMFGKDRIVGRALDNRLGGFIIAEVMRKLSRKKTKRPSHTVLCVNAVQEEIGGYGAKMATYRLMPDVCVCLDVTHATDTPGINHAVHGEVKLGKGPSLTHGTCNHPNVVRRLMEVAKEEGIPIQHESSSRYSGTDTDTIYPVKEGVPSALVSLPLRYMHSVVEEVDFRDVEMVIDLLTAFARSLKKNDDFATKL